jgi:spermidine/putrescine transport system permease protein
MTFFSVIPGLLWQISFLCIPLLFIIGLSFVKLDPAGPSLTLEYYRAVFDQIHLTVILRSLATSLFVATVCSLIAYPVAYLIALRMSNHWKNICLFFLTLPFWINFLLQIYAWYFILERNGLVNSLLQKAGLISEPLYLMDNQFAILLVMVHCYLPFMILPIYSGMAKFNTRLIEASYDLGASPAYTFWHVTLPLTISGIKTGFMLILVITFGEFTIPILMGGGKRLFVGTMVSDYIFMARNMSQGAAFMCVSGLAIGLTIGLVYQLFDRLTKVKGSHEAY